MSTQHNKLNINLTNAYSERTLNKFKQACRYVSLNYYILVGIRITKETNSITLHKMRVCCRNEPARNVAIEATCREHMCYYFLKFGLQQRDNRKIGLLTAPISSQKLKLLEHCEKIYNFEKSKIYTIEQDEQSNKFLLFIIPSKEWLSNTVLFSIFLLLIRYEQYFYNLEYNNATLSDICNIIFKENKICINSEFHSLGCLLGYQSSYKLVSKELFSRLLRMDFVLSNRKTLFDIPLLSFDETSDSVYMNKLGMDAFLDGQLYDKVATMRLVTSIEKYNNFYKSRYMEIQSNC